MSDLNTARPARITAAIAAPLPNCWGEDVMLTEEQQAKVLVAYDAAVESPDYSYEAIEANIEEIMSIVGDDACEAVCMALEWA